MLLIIIAQLLDESQKEQAKGGGVVVTVGLLAIYAVKVYRAYTKVKHEVSHEDRREEAVIERENDSAIVKHYREYIERQDKRLDAEGKLNRQLMAELGAKNETHAAVVRQLVDDHARILKEAHDETQDCFKRYTLLMANQGLLLDAIENYETALTEALIPFKPLAQRIKLKTESEVSLHSTGVYSDVPAADKG